MKFFRLSIFATILLLAGSLLFPSTGEKQEKVRLGYTSSTAFSLLLIRGNARTFSLSFETDQNLRFARDRYNLKTGIISSSSPAENAYQILSLSFQYDRKIAKRNYFLCQFSFNRNIPAGYRSRTAASSGLGIVWLDKKSVTLASDFTFAWSSENNLRKSYHSSEDSTKVSFMSSIASTSLSAKISATSWISFRQEVFLNYKKIQAFRLNSQLSFSAAVNKSLALKNSLRFTYENHPSPGFQKTDIYLMSSIVLNL